MDCVEINSLQDISNLSLVRCADFSEAASVCLEVVGHYSGALLKVTGDFRAEYELKREEVTTRMLDSRRDMEETVECGAYCLSMLIIEKLTGLQVIKQSQRRTGFDYWLGAQQNSLGFKDLARLEVSGILRGSKGQINQRLKEKMKQTKKSDNLELPAYVVIVEFSQLLVKVVRR